MTNSRAKPAPKKNRDLVILQEFARRKEKNRRYSLRAFAKDCGLSPSFVAYLNRGERSLSHDQYLEVCEKLGLVSGVDSAAKPQKSKSSEKKPAKHGLYKSAQFLDLPVRPEMNEFSYTDWQIADLTEIKGFKPDVRWIAKKLDLAPSVVAESVDRLVRFGILEAKGESLEKKNAKLYLSSERSIENLRRYHRESIGKALKELERTDDESFKRRKITGATLTLNERLVPIFREKLDHFIQEMIDLSSQETPTSLYQVNVQFFPLSRK